MISTMTPTPAVLLLGTAAPAGLNACPAATAAPKTAVVAATRPRVQDTSALRQVVSPAVAGSAGVPATGLTVAGAHLLAAADSGDAPVQGPPSRGTPV